MPRPPLRTARETLAALYVAAGLAVVLCQGDIAEVVARMEHGPLREQLLAVLAPAPDNEPTFIPLPSLPPLPAPVATVEAEEPSQPVWWRPVSEEDPLRVWVVGDSLVNMTAPELKRQLESTGLAQVRSESRPNTGLVREDHYSWPRRFDKHLSREDVDVIVMMVGANDSQNMMVDRKRIDLRTDAWLDEYARRVEVLMDKAEAAGVRMYWAGLPVMRKSRHRLTAQLVNPVIASAAEERSAVRYVSTWETFSDEEGGYRYWGLNDHGRKVSMRDADGVHFTMSGAIRLAEQLRAELESEWPLSGDGSAASEPDSGQP
jgi:hypothetical protein